MLDWQNELKLLRQTGVELSPGLSPTELANAEALYKFQFPPDLRSFLSLALPLGNFPNWRELGSHKLDAMMRWPLRGIQFDIEHGDFWCHSWGPRPNALTEALAVAAHEVATVSLLVPIYSHRYLPAEPSVAGNPVLSVYQTDVIYYGRELRDYFAHEFGRRTGLLDFAELRKIRFWSDLVEGNLEMPT